MLLSWGRFFVAKPLSQKHRSTFLLLQYANLTPFFGGFGLKVNRPLSVSGYHITKSRIAATAIEITAVNADHMSLSLFCLNQ